MTNSAADPAQRCARRGCTRTAVWRPVIVAHAPPEYGRHSPLRAQINLGVCGDCRRETRLEHVLDDRGWQVIVRGVRAQGMVSPDRARSRLDWILLTSREARGFDRARQQK